MATKKTKAQTQNATTSTARTASTGQRVGYVRVSSTDQNTARQIAEIGVVDRIFEDKLSGKNTNRPQLQALLGHVRGGDTVIVSSLDRLGRNLSDVENLVRQILEKGAAVEFKKENLYFEPDKTDARTVFFLQMMGAMAQLERAFILERQREGIAIAKQQGKYKGRKKVLNAFQTGEIRKRHAAGESVAVLADEFGVSRPTIYKTLKPAPSAKKSPA